MTRDEIFAMKPGKELDALVTEKVMGISTTAKWCRDAGEKEMCLWDEGNYEFGCDYLDKHKTNTLCPVYLKDELNNYSTNISAAWEVVEKLSEIDNGDFSIGIYQRKSFSPLWRCTITTEDCKQHPTYEPATAPEAICKAALLAMEVKS
ncbi:MAG: hypothetical protein Q8911_00390 [Bacillota bacterium]|nr:hypothetical protein [Bacillota bacterium]